MGIKTFPHEYQMDAKDMVSVRLMVKTRTEMLEKRIIFGK